MKRAGIPRKVNIGGHIFDVKFTYDIKDDKGTPCDGLTDNIKRIILIDRKLSPSAQQETFVHECLHVISYCYGMSLGEKKICRLSPALYQWFKDNKITFKEE